MFFYSEENTVRIALIIGNSFRVLFNAIIVNSGRLMSGNVGAHPVVIIFSIFFFGALFEGLGMLLAVPIMGRINVVMKYLIAGFVSSREQDDLYKKDAENLENNH